MSADDDVPVDQVISWTVPDQPSLQAGDTVLPGTSIVVVVSSGPAPRVVPELAAVPLADATSLVEAVDLVISVTVEEFSNDVPAGSVIAQDPVAGTELAPGTSVSVVVSKGPDLVAVPSLAGLGVQQATDALAAAGLVIGTVSGDPAGVNVLATVGGVSIGGGAHVPPRDRDRSHLRGAGAAADRGSGRLTDPSGPDSGPDTLRYVGGGRCAAPESRRTQRSR